MFVANGYYSQQINKKEVFELLHWANISSKERQLLNLYYIHGYTFKEISINLNLTPHAVVKTIHKTLDKLRRYV